MPSHPAKPCRHCGCHALVRDGSGFCSTHQDDKKINSFADKRRGSRHQRGYGTAWDKLRLAILKRDNGLCQACLRQGFITAAKIVDHIKPKFEGGSDNYENLESVCQSCSDTKTQQEAQRARRGV